MNIKQLVIIGTVLVLSACVTTDTPGSKASGGKWVNVGVSIDENVLHELDKSSIKRTGNIVTFRDRKTIDNIDKEHFLNVPVHKMSINNWEINCQAKTYRLINMDFFDEKGQSLGGVIYPEKDVAPMRIVRGSTTEKQQQIVCQ